MKLIKPLEISAKILTLFDETKSRIIIVSPYMKISKWYKLVNQLNGLKRRGIIPQIYVRDDKENEGTYSDLETLDLSYKKLPHLHSKIYLNDSCAIVTSMNLLLSSDINSLEFGYITESQQEYNDVFEYYLRYIRKGKPILNEGIAEQLLPDMEEFFLTIRKEFSEMKINAWPNLERNVLHISTGRNNYIVKISNSHLKISVTMIVDPGKKRFEEQDSLLIAKNIKDLTAMKIQILPDTAPHRIQLSGEAHHALKSTCIKGILKDESRYIIDSLKKFISAAESSTEK